MNEADAYGTYMNMTRNNNDVEHDIKAFNTLTCEIEVRACSFFRTCSGVCATAYFRLFFKWFQQKQKQHRVICMERVVGPNCLHFNFYKQTELSHYVAFFLLAISARTYFKSHHRHEQLRAHETQNNAP